MKYIIFLLFILVFSRSSLAQTSSDYSILDRISIFSRTRLVGPTTRPVVSPITPPPTFFASLKDDIGFLAILESNLKKIYLRIGDTVEWNETKVINITMDKLYLSNNIIVIIGNNLLNQSIQTRPLNSLPTRGMRGSRGRNL